jgi:nicotinamide phosphoribosyltransferase
LIIELKEEILLRDGKLVIRPDSGDPVDIICGKEMVFSHNNKDGNGTTLKQNPNENERLGVIELLWNVFGGTINEQGYKILDSHIGAIYGDSINLDRAEQICSRLEAKGFASTNVVLGIGSFTYQFNTRDTFGFAMKATYVEINGVGQEIFKDPITDDGVKKSAVGLLKVFKEKGVIKLQDKCTWEEEETGLLKVIYKDGTTYNNTTLTEIRERLNG